MDGGSLGTLFVCGQVSAAQWIVCEQLLGRKIRGIFGNFNHSVCVADNWELHWWKHLVQSQLETSHDHEADDTTAQTKELGEQHTISTALEGVRIHQVAFGKAHALALSLDGEIFSWGTREAVMQGDLAQSGLFQKKRPASNSNNQTEELHGSSPPSSFSTTLEKPEATATEINASVDRQDAGTPGMPVLRGGSSDSTNFVAPKRVLCAKDLFFCKIAAGDFHCAAINSKNELYTWGRNLDVQLGHSLRKLSTEQAQLQCGIYATPRFVPFFLHQKVVDVACGENSTVVLLDSGELYGFGVKSTRDASGKAPHKLMDKALDGTKFVAVACGECHSLALSSSGVVYAWGLNVYGQLGIGQSKSVAMPQPLEFQPSTTVVARIFASGNYSAAISTNGELFTWGNGAYGKLGHETSAKDCADDSTAGDKKWCATSCEWTPRRVERLENVFVSVVACEKRNLLAFAPSFVQAISPQCGDLNGNYPLRISGSGFWPSEEITVRFVPLNEGCLARGAIGTFDEKSQQIVCSVPKFVQPGEFAVEVAMNGKNFTSNGHMFEAFCAPRAVLVSLREARACGDEPGSIKLIGSFPVSCRKPLIRFVPIDETSTSFKQPLGITQAELTVDDKLTHDGEHQGFVKFHTPPLRIDQLTPCTLEISFNDGVQFVPVDIRLKGGATDPKTQRTGVNVADSARSLGGVPHVVLVHDAQVAAIVPNSFLLNALPLSVCVKVRDLFDLGPGTVSVGLRYTHQVKNKTFGVAETALQYERLSNDSLSCVIPPLDQWQYTPQVEGGDDYDLLVQSDTPWFRQLGLTWFEAQVQLSLNGGKSLLPCAGHSLFGFCQGTLTSATPNCGPLEGGTKVEIASNFFNFDSDDVVVSVHWKDKCHLLPASCRMAADGSSRVVHVELPTLPFPKKPQEHLEQQQQQTNALLHRGSAQHLPSSTTPPMHPHESNQVPTSREEAELSVALNGVHFAESTIKFLYYEPPNLVELSALEALPGTKLVLKVDRLIDTGLIRVKLTNAITTDPVVSEIFAVEVNEPAHTVEFVVPTLSITTSQQLQVAFSLNGQQFSDKVAVVARNPSGGSLPAATPVPEKGKNTKASVSVSAATASAAAAAAAAAATALSAATPPTEATAPTKITFLYKVVSNSTEKDTDSHPNASV